MRTSRVSQDTARLISALSSRRSLRSHDVKPEQKIEQEEGDILLADSETELSPPPSDLDIPLATPVSSRKRKRVSIKQNASPSTSSRLTQPDALPTKTSPSSIPKRAKRQPAKRVTSAPGDIKIEPPPGWEALYALTAQMRSTWPAPVDTMGCESLAEDSRSPRDRRFQTLVALMLSSQTKDTVTAVAMKNLQDNLLGGFTLESILAVEPDVLNELIGKVGFHNNKTKFIKSTAEILRDQFDSDIPDTIDGMISLPGVGPKMAYLCMSAAWGRDEGIGVDVHVHRITNLWGWHKTRTPEETRASLEAWLPKEKWHDINHLLVGFGQTWCPPVGRKCGDCELGQKRMCPSAVMGREVKRVKKEVVKVEDGRGAVKVEEEVETQIKEEPENEDAERPAALPQTLQDIEDIGR
jgi:endonuclease-3